MSLLHWTSPCSSESIHDDEVHNLPCAEEVEGEGGKGRDDHKKVEHVPAVFEVGLRSAHQTEGDHLASGTAKLRRGG